MGGESRQTTEVACPAGLLSTLAMSLDDPDKEFAALCKLLGKKSNLRGLRNQPIASCWAVVLEWSQQMPFPVLE